MKDSLREHIERQTQRWRKAEREQPTLMGQTVFLGTLGLVFVLPVVGGAYLGRWIDEQFPGYSIRWTLSMISLGLVIGAVNVYLLIRDSEHE